MEFETIARIVADQMNIAVQKVTMETSFTDDLGADSLDLFQIIAEIEETFHIELTNEAAETVQTVGDAVAYIKKNV